MPRRPNTRPTNIYWLFDMRPETLAIHPLGWPFYCGKTVQSVSQRLKEHKNNALKRPKGLVAGALIACDGHVRVEVVEVVAAGDGWGDRERHWIRALRHLNPKCANVSVGGDGAPGYIHREESRRKISASNRGRTLSEQTKRDIAAANLGKKHTDETRAKMRAAHTGVFHSEESKQKMRIVQRGKVISPEQREKIRQSVIRHWREKCRIDVDSL